MNKSFGKLFLISLSLILGISTAKSFELSIDDQYFLPHTKISINNWSEITFDDNSNEGFGAFFLGTGIASNTTLTLSGRSSQIKNCKTQLNGYFLTNYTNFLMIPIDKNTENTLSNNHPELLGEYTKFITGGFFTDCDNGTGIFGYIEFSYLSGEDVNTHKLRAGINKNNSSQRSFTSPLQIFSSYNWNTLSGEFYSSLAHFGNTIPSLIGGYTIQNARYDATGNKYVVTGNEIDLIFWSTHDGSFSFSGGTTILNGNISGNKILKTGHITLPSNSNTHKLTYTLSSPGYDDFTISGDIAPLIIIDKSNINFEPNICTSGDVIASITGRDSTLTVSGFQWNSEPRSTIPTKTMTGNNTGTYKIWFNNGNIKGGEYVLTNIDKQAPIITGVIFSGGYAYFSGLECNTITGVLDKVDNFCGDENITCSFDGGEYSSGLVYSLYSGEVSHKTIVYSMIDGVGNETTGEIYFDWQDVPVTGHGIKMYLDNNNELYENWIEITEAKAGTCENLSAEVIESQLIKSIVTGGNCEISGEFIKLSTQSNNILVKGIECKIRITDGDSDIEVTITGEINRNAPTFSKNIEFIGGSGYINRGLNKYGLKKLTNDKKVLVHFEGDSPTEINSFRMSCISGDNICTEIETIDTGFSSFICNSLYPIGHKRGDWSNNSDYNNTVNKLISQDAINRCMYRLDGGWIGNLYTFFSRDDKYTTDLVKCKKIDEARSNRYQVNGDYTSTDNYSFENKKIFENNTIKYHFSGTILRDLEDGSGCQPTVFGSPELGYRDVYVQVKNTKSKESEKKGSEEIFYDNINPVINTREYERIITMQGYTTNVGNISIYDPKINYKKKGIVSNELGNLYQAASKNKITTEGLSVLWNNIGDYGLLGGLFISFLMNSLPKNITANTPYSLINMNIGTDYWHTIGSCVKTGKESKFISYLTGENKLDEDEFKCDCSKCNASEVITTGTKINDGCECTNGVRSTYNTKINDTCVGQNPTEIPSNTYIDDTCYCNNENGGYINTGTKIDETCQLNNEKVIFTGSSLNVVQNIYAENGFSCKLTNTTTERDIPEGLKGNYEDMGYSCILKKTENGECTKKEDQCKEYKCNKKGNCIKRGILSCKEYECLDETCIKYEEQCVEREQINYYDCSRNEIKCTQYECIVCPENDYICTSYSKYDCYDCNEYNCCKNNGDSCSEYLCDYNPCTAIDQNKNVEYFVFGIHQSSIYPPLFEPNGRNTPTRGTTKNTDNDLIELYLSGGNNRLTPISGNISFNWDITKAERGVGDDGELDSRFAYTMNIKNIVIDNLSVEGKGEVWLHLKTGFATDFAGNPTNEHREKTNIEIVNKDILGEDSPYTLGTQDTKQIIHVYTMSEDLELGTGSIICKSSSLCQGFSCNEKGVTKVKSVQKTIDGVIYHKEREITLDKMTLDTGVDEKNFTGCIIELTDNNKSRFQNTGVNIDIKLYANLGIFMAGDAGDETRRPISEVLNNANRDGLQDKGFLFYISQPHITKFGNTTGALGNLNYEMEFNGGEVVDEYYYITGTAIVNGFFNEIGIKKPTYNYKNPNAWQSTFPVY